MKRQQRSGNSKYSEVQAVNLQAHATLSTTGDTDNGYIKLINRN